MFEPMPQMLYTAADLAEMDGDFELDRGRLVPVTPAKRPHGYMHGRVFLRVGNFVEQHHLGEMFIDLGCWIERNPDTVRGPDIAFVRAERIAVEGDEDGWYEGPPDLAIEITARGSRSKMRRRIAQLLGAGCPLLWHIVIPDRTVTVHAAGHAPRILREGDVLDGGDLLPGFDWEISDLFSRSGGK